MTMQEILQKYKISPDLLNKYKKLRKYTGYCDKDIENISMIMTLYDAGFDDNETEVYIKLYLSDEDTNAKRSAMLSEKRECILSAIHSKQKQLDAIDYLRYKILNKNEIGK